MIAKINTARIKIWGQEVGAVVWLEQQGYAVFEFSHRFLETGLDISPIQMSLKEARDSSAVFSFPALNKETYLGLPGLLADALPDRFGNSIIDSWLARNGRDKNNFSPIERLCYIGERAMGALQFYPAYDDQFNRVVPIEMTELVGLTQRMMAQVLTLDTGIHSSSSISKEAIMDILRVGTSAGGARPKAVIAMNSAGLLTAIENLSKLEHIYLFWISFILVLRETIAAAQRPSKERWGCESNLTLVLGIQNNLTKP